MQPGDHAQGCTRKLLGRTHRQDVRFSIRHFEGFKLTVHQRWRKEMNRMARGNARLRRLAADCHEHKANSRHGGPQAVPITALQRRAGQHRPVFTAGELAAEPIEPILPVLIVERGSQTHLFTARHGMKIIAFDQRRSGMRGKCSGKAALAAAAHAHHHNPSGCCGHDAHPPGRAAPAMEGAMGIKKTRHGPRRRADESMDRILSEDRQLRGFQAQTRAPAAGALILSSEKRTPGAGRLLLDGAILRLMLPRLAALDHHAMDGLGAEVIAGRRAECQREV
jgi:hypothetical protein